MSKLKVSNTLVSVASVIVLSGCASNVKTINSDLIQFKGDAPPLVTSSDAVKSNFENLSEGETIIVALTGDGSGAISQPNIAKVDVFVELLANAKSQQTLELLMDRCDPDRDGIWDVYCPELLNIKVKDQLQHQKHVLFQSSYQVSRDEKGESGSYAWINKSKEKKKSIPLYLELNSINRGNKHFHGDLDTYINVPPQVEFERVVDTKKIRDQSGTIETLMMIPYINLIAMGMKNFKSVPTKATFEVEKTEGRRVRIRAKGINLKPGEGVRIKYLTSYLLEGQLTGDTDK